MADAQTIRRVNNNLGITGLNVYTTIQAAHDAAVAGDIIYIEPSLNSYGSLNSIKNLTILGNGYDLNQNANTAIDKKESMISGFTFSLGSENSIMMGIVSSNLSDDYVYAPNITITRCKISKLIILKQLTGNTTNILPNNLTITKSKISNISTLGPNFSSNHSITNNIVDFAGYSYNGSSASIKSSIISNNVFTGLINSDGANITNNIFISSASGDAINGSANLVNNNLSTIKTLISSNGNVNNVTLSSLFIVADPQAGGIIDNELVLKVGSPAIGAGTGSADCGIFGGASPYVLSGLPSLPIITNLIYTTVGNSTTPLNVSVTVRGNN